MLLKEYIDAANAPTTVMITNVSSSAARSSQAKDTINFASLFTDAFKAV